MFNKTEIITVEVNEVLAVMTVRAREQGVIGPDEAITNWSCDWVKRLYTCTIEKVPTTTEKGGPDATKGI